MAIYDNDGTTSYQIGKVYDNDGTSSHQIGKLYDHDGTSNYLVYTAVPNIVVPNQSDYPASAWVKGSRVTVAYSGNTVVCTVPDSRDYLSANNGAYLAINTSEAKSISVTLVWKSLGNSGNAYRFVGFSSTPSYTSANIASNGPEWSCYDKTFTLNANVTNYNTVYFVVNSGTGNRDYSSGGVYYISSLTLT